MGSTLREPSRRRLLILLALGFVAGALGWGIRGQFGGETGATVPGALFGLVVALALPPGRRGATPLLLGAVGALGLSIGGSMTYGQTLGLVHGEPHSPTLAWGLLGLAIKGGVWVALGGLILGMAAGGVRYPTSRLLLIWLGALGAYVLGIWVLNSPHHPPDRLPAIYFSNRLDEPRHESWGGLVLGTLWLLLWAAIHRDRVALRLSLFGLVGGAFGFAMGEALQAWGSLGRPLGDWGARWVDWWKVMECFFGGCAGLTLALGAATLPPGEAKADPGPLRRFSWPAALTVVWVIAYLFSDAEVLPLGLVTAVPFIGIALPLLCCFAERGRESRPTAFVVLVGMVLLLSALNVAGKILDVGPPGATVVAGCLGVVALIAVFLTAIGAWARPLPAERLIGFVAVSQTALTWLKSVSGASWGEGFHAFVGGSGIAVELGFVVLMAATLTLAGMAVGGRPAEVGEAI